MLSFSGSLRVFVAVEACDMRKGFEGLSALVGSVLNEEVKSGALFAFSNRRRTRLKILYWDGSGLWVLEQTAGKGNLCVAEAGGWSGRQAPLESGSPFDADGRNRSARGQDASLVRAGVREKLMRFLT